MTIDSQIEEQSISTATYNLNLRLNVFIKDRKFFVPIF